MVAPPKPRARGAFGASSRCRRWAPAPPARVTQAQAPCRPSSRSPSPPCRRWWSSSRSSGQRGRGGESGGDGSRDRRAAGRSRAVRRREPSRRRREERSAATRREMTAQQNLEGVLLKQPLDRVETCARTNKPISHPECWVLVSHLGSGASATRVSIAHGWPCHSNPSER